MICTNCTYVQQHIQNLNSRKINKNVAQTSRKRDTKQKNLTNVSAEKISLWTGK